jgi:phospholipid/cholesterol/gamma-HCH transport system ATP-binding protein
MSIRFASIKKSFGSKRVIDDVSFEVKVGEVFFIIGASGVGKSVLIKQVVGLLAPDDGEIWLDGQEISGCTPCGRSARWSSSTRRSSTR